MQKITLISVGKLKEPYFKQAESEYIKRLNGLCDFSKTEIPQTSLPQSPSNAQIQAALKKEGELILTKIPKNAFVIPLCVEAKVISSEELAQKIGENANVGSGNIVFIIGGSYGLSDEIKLMGNWRISMSRMTFPHRLAQIMLLEQVYRALQINRGSEYHK